MDLIIVGGGLRGSLLAIALAERHPNVDFLVIEKASRFGGGPIDPFFVDHLPIASHSLFADAIVSEWSTCLIASGSKVERREWPGALVMPAQLHAEVLRRVPGRHLMAQVQSRSVSDRSVITSRGTYKAKQIIDFSSRAESTGLRLWCRSANFELPENQKFPAPILADIGTDQPRIAQYIPSAPFNVTVRSLEVSDQIPTQNLPFAMMPEVDASMTGYPLTVTSATVPGLPANPLLPSNMYEAADLVEALMGCDFRDHVDLSGIWSNLRAAWQDRHLGRAEQLERLADAAPAQLWQSISTAGELSSASSVEHG